MFTDLKEFFYQQIEDKKIRNQLQLKCLAILPFHFSLITIHISDCRQFSEIYISQGSVAA